MRQPLARLARHKHLRVMPIIDAMRGSSGESLKSDARAALNVSLLALPQGMAYAAIAGLPIEYGIFGAIVAALIAPVFSGSRYISPGPSNATAVLIFGALLSLNLPDPADRTAVMSLIVLLAGLLLVLGAMLKVAALVQYVSRAVIAGYITAAALYIIANQMKQVLGYDFTLPPDGTMVDVLLMTLQYLPEIHLPTVLLSIGAAAFYWVGNRHAKALPNVGLTLILFSLLAVLLQILGLPGWDGIRTLNAVNATEWQVALPPFSQELVREVSSSAMVLAFLCMLEGCSIGKTLAARSGEKIDLNQEIFGLGIANIACAFYKGMPASGSYTRSQLNFNSGARTAMSTVLAGLFCVLGVFLLGPLIGYIPVSLLGVVVIAIGLSLINRHVIRVVWRATRSDRVVFITTFVAAMLASLDFAIILGVAVSILLFLRKAAKPELIEYTRDKEGVFMPMGEHHEETTPEVSIVHVEGDLFFGAAELFRDQMRRAFAKPNLKVVILKMRNAHHLDATSVLALEDLIRFLQGDGRALLISEARPDAVKIFRDSGLLKVLGDENLFPDEPSNPTLSTSRAIRRAMTYLDGQEAEVKIFLGGSQKESAPHEEP